MDGKKLDRRKAAWVNVSVFLFVLSAATVINLVAGNSRDRKSTRLNSSHYS